MDPDNTLIVASAGSGKTSTIVGKVGYLLEKGLAKPSEILLLSFAKKVKDERITMTAIVIIGDVIKPKSYEYSKLYDKTFSHGFRKAKPTKKKN